MRGDRIRNPVNISSDENGDNSSDGSLDTSSDEPGYISSDEAEQTSSDEQAYSSSDDGVDTSSDEGMFSNGKHRTFEQIKCGHDLYFNHLHLWVICLLNY